MSVQRVLAVAALLAASASASADDRADLAAAFAKAFASGSFRAEIATTTAGRAFSATTDVQLPDRFHMKTPDAEFIIVPQGTWMKVGGQWMKSPVDASRMVQGYDRSSIDAGIAALDDVSRVGTEDVNGCPSTIYRYRTRAEFLGVGRQSEAEVAVCSRNGLPVRVVSRGDEPVTIHYDFEADIDIRPPR